MRILLINQFFHPSSVATSHLLTDLARYLAELGHEVTVICENGKSDSNEANPEPSRIAIERVSSIPFGRGRYRRVLSYASFYVGAAWSALSSRRPDIVVTLTTPPLLSVIGTLVNKFKGSRHVSWEMDVYPAIAVELGVLRKNGWFTGLVRGICEWSRGNADTVIALGDDMRDLLLSSGLDQKKVVVVENWADSTEIKPMPFPLGTLRLLYSGNLGLAHDASTLEMAMLACNVPELAGRFHFTFSGGGIRRRALEEFARNHKLSNVSFWGWSPSVTDILAKCHVGLVTQHVNVIGSAVPSKVYGILAAGRPVIYVGPDNTMPLHILRRFDCGWHVSPGDTNGLLELLHRLDADRSLIHGAGRRARQAVLDYYDRPIALQKLSKVIVGQLI